MTRTGTASTVVERLARLALPTRKGRRLRGFRYAEPRMTGALPATGSSRVAVLHDSERERTAQRGREISGLSIPVDGRNEISQGLVFRKRDLLEPGPEFFLQADAGLMSVQFDRALRHG